VGQGKDLPGKGGCRVVSVVEKGNPLKVGFNPGMGGSEDGDEEHQR